LSTVARLVTSHNKETEGIWKLNQIAQAEMDIDRAMLSAVWKDEPATSGDELVVTISGRPDHYYKLVKAQTQRRQR
jgi:hypothetical protein